MIHARHAIKIAKSACILHDETNNWPISMERIHQATNEDIQNFSIWTKRMMPSSASEGLESTDSVDQNITSIIDQFNQLQERYNEVQGPTIHHVAVMDSLSEVDVPGLHKDQ